MDMTLKVSGEMLQLIVGKLAKFPYEEVGPTIDEIKRQVNEFNAEMSAKRLAESVGLGGEKP